MWRAPVLALAISLAFPLAPAQAQTPPPTLNVPAHIRAFVTGDPAGADFITAQINAAIARDIARILPAGSSVRATAILPAPQPLARGFHTSFAVALAIVGPAAAGTSATTVDVDNVDLPGFAPVTLAFRDDPERIVADGVLSRTTIDIGHPSRVYYYHQNARSRRRFCVVLSVTNSVVSHVHIVAAAAGPNIDVMSVGHAVTKTLLAEQPHDEGSVLELAGGKPFLQRDDVVSSGDGVVGSIDLRVLDGGPVTLTVLAIPTDADPASYLYTAKLAADGHGRHGNFDLTGFGQQIIAYTAGGRDATYVYGVRARTLPNVDPADTGQDFGDYGVLQRVAFDLANPTPEPVTLYFYEKPLGGVVRSSFLVNGTLTDMGCARLALRYTVVAYELAAHTTAVLDVLTMTDGGSNYPLEIGVTSHSSLPSTPPMSAPEGCFPKPAPSAK